MLHIFRSPVLLSRTVSKGLGVNSLRTLSRSHRPNKLRLNFPPTQFKTLQYQQLRFLSEPKHDTQTKIETKQVPESTILEQIQKESQLWTIPNILTYTRIITTPFIGYFIVSGDTTMALSLFVYSSVTDFVDGFIARRFNMKSVVGSIIDPLADKFLMTVCTLSLAYVNSIPGLVATVIIGRDVMLSFMSFYYRYKSLDPPRTFDKFISISQNPTISVHPSLLGKVNTGLQMLYIGGLVFKPLIETSLALSLDSAFLGMGAVVTATTILSGYTYVFGKNSFKYIK